MSGGCISFIKAAAIRKSLKSYLCSELTTFVLSTHCHSKFVKKKTLSGENVTLLLQILQKLQNLRNVWFHPKIQISREMQIFCLLLEGSETNFRPLLKYHITLILHLAWFIALYWMLGNEILVLYTLVKVKYVIY